MDNDKPWRDDPIIISEQTLNNVVVVSNPNPYQVIVSTAGGTELRIDTRQSIPRKLVPRDYLKLIGLLLRWPDTSKNQAEKKAGKFEKTQYLGSQSGKHFNDVPIAGITSLTPTPPQAPARPKNIREPRDNLGGQNHPGKSLWVMFPRTSISFFRA